MTRKIKDLTPQEVLALAIRIEQANALRLRNFAFAFQNYDKEVSERFEELAAEEDSHEKWLRTRFAKMFKGPLPPAEDLDVEGMAEVTEWDDSEYLVFDSLRADHVYHLAMKAEKKAESFYQRAKRSTKDKGLAKLFEELAEMEAGHTGWLAEKIEARPITGMRKILYRLKP